MSHFEKDAAACKSLRIIDSVPMKPAEWFVEYLNKKLEEEHKEREKAEQG